MIPRKRLQVLLYVLQVFYVFGDGDPGKGGEYHLHLPTNNNNELDLVDEPPATNLPPISPPNTYHRIHERVSSDENEDDDDAVINKFINMSTDVYDLRDEAGGGLDAPDNVISDDLNIPIDNKDSFTTVTPSSTTTSFATSITTTTTAAATTTTVAPTIVKSVEIKVTLPTALNVTWTISGENTRNYVVDLYESDSIKTSYKSPNLHYYIKDLEPCTLYKVGVRVEESNLTKFASATTLHDKPSEPTNLKVAPDKKSSLALQIDWKPPKYARRCVMFYKVSIDNGQEPRDTRDANATETASTFENVFACRTYSVTVFTFSVNGEPGGFAKNDSILTLPDVTIPPRLNETHESQHITRDTITLSWIVSDPNNNCLLKSIESECKYNYTEGHGLQPESNKAIVRINEGERPRNVTVKIDRLTSYTHYKCRSRTLVRDLPANQSASPWSEAYEFVTEEDVPSHPREFKVINKGESSKRTFRWERPSYIPGKLLGYRIKFLWTPNYRVPDACPADWIKIYDIDVNLTEYSIAITDDYSDSTYEAAISARTKAGWSSEAFVKDAIMQRGVPDKVTNMHTEIVTLENDTNSLDTVLYWSLPCISKGLLYQFDVSYVGTRPGYESHNLTDSLNLPEVYDKNEIFEFHFGELRPLYNYTFEVSATLYGSIDPGESAFLSMIYPPGIPPQPDEEYIRSIRLDPRESRRSTTTAFVLLPVFPADYGEIKHYAIMVSGRPFANESARFEVDERTRIWPDVKSWEEAKEENFEVPYQATVSFWKPASDNIADYGNMKAIKFVIGEDITCPQISSNTKDRVYCNGPLNPDSWYEVRMRAYTEKGYADSPSFMIKTNAELNVGLVLGVVFGILFIGTTTTLMLMIKRCSLRLLVQRILQSGINESPVPNPFTRRKFINHCQQLAENPAKLTNEFHLLQTLSIDLQMPSNHACLQGNRKKNRYSDILPYDFSRVKLEVIDNDPCSDYINASFIKGYSGNDEYIACQGPKEETTYDFWRMIDEYDVKIILMLTQLVERGKEKCHQYFPTARETFTYEKFSIKCTSELDYRNYTQRTLVLEKDGVKRTITHWHFKDWPDHDVPDDFDAMLHFVQMFRKQLNSVKGLSVIHCSAGIGRTGTLIAIDILLQSLKDCRKIDVFGTVYRLRRHRLNMVQRESQYAYIYNCIRQVLKNPYFSKTYKPPPIDPIYAKAKTQKNQSDSSTDLVESFDTLRKNSLTTSMDSMQPLCQSSPQATPKIQMNVLFAGLRYCKSTSAIDTRSNHNRIGKYNSENYVACETRDSFSTASKESAEDDVKSSTSSIYENVEPLIRTGSSQTIAGASYIPLTNDAVEKDTSL